MRRCFKQRHLSMGKAHAHVRHLEDDLGKPRGHYQAYVCGRCHAWHVGRMTRHRLALERIP